MGVKGLGGKTTEVKDLLSASHWAHTRTINEPFHRRFDLGHLAQRPSHISTVDVEVPTLPLHICSLWKGLDGRPWPPLLARGGLTKHHGAGCQSCGGPSRHSASGRPHGCVCPQSQRPGERAVRSGHSRTKEVTHTRLPRFLCLCFR